MLPRDVSNVRGLDLDDRRWFSKEKCPRDIRRAISAKQKLNSKSSKRNFPREMIVYRLSSTRSLIRRNVWKVHVQILSSGIKQVDLVASDPRVGGRRRVVMNDGGVRPRGRHGWETAAPEVRIRATNGIACAKIIDNRVSLKWLKNVHVYFAQNS